MTVCPSMESSSNNTDFWDGTWNPILKGILSNLRVEFMKMQVFNVGF